jgi:hypothetical protein
MSMNPTFPPLPDITSTLACYQGGRLRSVLRLEKARVLVFPNGHVYAVLLPYQLAGLKPDNHTVFRPSPEWRVGRLPDAPDGYAQVKRAYPNQKIHRLGVTHPNTFPKYHTRRICQQFGEVDYWTPIHA